MRKVKLNNQEYEIIKDENSVFDEVIVVEKCTDYFIPFDYILGDYAYDKLRLKGFYDSNNPQVSLINDIKQLDNYIENYCSYGAKYFLLKKVK